MGKFRKKSATKDEADPAVIKASTKVNLKKQKVDVTGTMDALADRVQRIEAKVDLLMTKADLLISAKGKKPTAKKAPAKAPSKTEGSYIISYSDDEVAATKAPCSIKGMAESSSSEDESSSSDEASAKTLVASAKPAVKVENATPATSSSDSSDEEGDKDEKPAQKKAKPDTNTPKKESTSDDSSDESDEKESNGRFGFAAGRFSARFGGGGRRPFGGRFGGGRCGGQGFCGRC